jgi:hypothetical protein
VRGSATTTTNAGRWRREQLERSHQGADMTIVTFLLLLVIAAIGAGVWSLIVGWSSRGFAGAFAFGALLLVLPALLPKLLGG